MSVHRNRAEKRAGIARALAKEGFEDVFVLDRESAERVLTANRTELLDRLRDGEVESVRGLARRLDRDKGSVSRDLDLLARHDLVTFHENGTRKIPEIKHGTVIVEPVV